MNWLNKIKIIGLLSIIFILLSFNAFAVKEISTVFPDEGFSISSPLYDTHKINTKLSLFFQVFNSSTGIILSSPGCYLDIANPNRTRIFHGVNLTPDEYYVYSFNINADNFTLRGQYDYSIRCNDSFYGGSSVSLIEITSDGFSKDTYHSIIYAILAIIGLIISFIYLKVASMLGNDEILSLIKYFCYGVALVFPFGSIGVIYTALGFRNTWVNMINSVFQIHVWSFVLLFFLMIAYAIWLIGKRYKKIKRYDI